MRKLSWPIHALCAGLLLLLVIISALDLANPGPALRCYFFNMASRSLTNLSSSSCC
jgi:hypothetical protein